MYFYSTFILIRFLSLSFTRNGLWDVICSCRSSSLCSQQSRAKHRHFWYICHVANNITGSIKVYRSLPRSLRVYQTYSRLVAVCLRLEDVHPITKYLLQKRVVCRIYRPVLLYYTQVMVISDKNGIIQWHLTSILSDTHDIIQCQMTSYNANWYWMTWWRTLATYKHISIYITSWYKMLLLW